MKDAKQQSIFIDSNRNQRTEKKNNENLPFTHHHHHRRDFCVGMGFMNYRDNENHRKVMELKCSLFVYSANRIYYDFLWHFCSNIFSSANYFRHTTLRNSIIFCCFFGFLFSVFFFAFNIAFLILLSCSVVCRLW